VKRKVLLSLLALGAAATVVVVANAGPPDGPQLASVPTADTKATGYAPASRLSPGLSQVVLAQGSMRLENPQGIVTNYGYENDVSSPGDPSVPLMVPSGALATEAQKTEPDKNTYLVLKDGQPGADANYDYGTHFLYQGHEGAASVNGQKQGSITRINLDADSDHRVTLLATHDTNGQLLATIDGSTWDPFSQRLVFTTESATAPTYAATLGYPSTVEDVSGDRSRHGR
jgi:type 1 fimbria pilin